MTHVHAIHAAVENIQKSLQKYVKFPDMDYDYCNEMNEFLDSAENWCLRVDEMYNEAEVHSINTSKGDLADVGVWVNSAQKGNRLFNKHLSEEIKSKFTCQTRT